MCATNCGATARNLDNRGDNIEGRIRTNIVFVRWFAAHAQKEPAVQMARFLHDLPALILYTLYPNVVTDGLVQRC